jgi:Fe-S cluster assembly ATP-binding protein
MHIGSIRANLNFNALEMLKFIRSKMAAIEMDETLLKRSLNEGFSGGEKKRNEILQMTLLEPTLAILDETDSGLDIDALRIVANGVNQLRSPERSFIVVTHYQRLLSHIIPDYVHILSNGKIVATGDKTLAEKLEVEGYEWIRETNSITT